MSLSGFEPVKAHLPAPEEHGGPSQRVDEVRLPQWFESRKRKKKHLPKGRCLFMSLSGFEPETHALKVRCSTD